jgi:hypothetical protein
MFVFLEYNSAPGSTRCTRILGPGKVLEKAQSFLAFLSLGRRLRWGCYKNDTTFSAKQEDAITGKIYYPITQTQQAEIQGRQLRKCHFE